MQTDMHYYGTYCMARAAGLDGDASRVIATSAQFVDDNAAQGNARFEDGGGIDFDATAHHAADLRNIHPEDQRQVWVPFHFLPGNEGDSYSERLVCRKDSKIARNMMAHHSGLSEKPYALALLGIGAHVYADTFSHYGFSGVSSRWNRIEEVELDPEGVLSDQIRSYIEQKAQSFAKKYAVEMGRLENFRSRLRTFVADFKGEAAEQFSGALGHGAALTYPDRPYLTWRFTYEHPDDGSRSSGLRDNPTTFLQGCRALHGIFQRFADARRDRRADAGRDFPDIERVVRRVLATQAPMDGRIDAWREAAEAGELFVRPESIPAYDGERWNRERERLTEQPDSARAVDAEAYHFYQAAAAHRTYVLRDLLPTHELVVA